MANRMLSGEEETEIKRQGNQFVDQWTSHNQDLLASFTVLNNLFLVVAVDENLNNPGGCSIDKLFSYVQQLEKQFQLNLLDRRALAYEQDGSIRITRLDTVEKMYRDGVLSDDQLVYNNLVQSKAELDSNWRVELRNSWIRQMI